MFRTRHAFLAINPNPRVIGLIRREARAENDNVSRHSRNYVARHHMVGVAGFEPTASSSRTKRATKLRHTPVSCDSINSSWYKPESEIAPGIAREFTQGRRRERAAGGRS